MSCLELDKYNYILILNKDNVFYFENIFFEIKIFDYQKNNYRVYLLIGVFQLVSYE